MSKKQVHPENISVEDMQVWTEYLATGTVQDDNHAKQLTRLGKRAVNLADVATIVDFMARRNDGFITALIEQNGTHEKILNKLGATNEVWDEAKKEYNEELDAIQAEVAQAQETIKAQMEKGE